MTENGNGDGCDATAGPSQDVDAAAAHVGSVTTPVVAPRASSSYCVMNHTFRVDPRYSALKAIGKGSFGVVCSAADEKQAKRVAIKKIHPMAQHVLDAKHVLREIRLMRYLGVHPNIISLEDLFVSEYHDELYIVMELLDSDLHRIIQSPQALGDAHHRYFMYQLLKGVKFLHDNRIIHRDLKPGNLLVTKSCQLRITDFGLARLRPMGRGADPDDEVDHPMTEHVVTRWYRPPELMLCPDGLYGYAVDLWSVGCILAELLGRQPLFPGKNFLDQLTLIFDVVGSPEEHEVAHIRNQQAKRFLESMRDRVKVPFADLFPSASDPAVNLLERLLVFHPPSRITVDEALEHSYFHPLRGNDHSPELEMPQGLEFDFEREPLCRLELKKMIIQEVDSFQRAQRKRDRQARGGAVLAGATSVSSANAASSALPTTARGVVPANAPGDGRHAAGDAGSDSNEQQRHLRRQRLRRRQAELSTVTAAAAAAAAATVTPTATATASAAGASATGAGDSTVVRAEGRERPPIAALPSNNQIANEAGKARASQSSHRHMRVPSSHWRPAVAVAAAAAAAAAAVTAAAAAAAATAPPPRDNSNPVRATDKSPVDESHKTSSTTAPMDDEEARTPPPEAAQGGPIRPPPTPEYQMRHCGVQWAGGGDDVRWAAGRQMMTSDHWRYPERGTGGGLSGGMHEVNFNGRFPLPQPYPRAGQELDRYHIPPHASSAWPPLSNAVGPAMGAAVGPAVGLCDSPVRVRRSTASGAMGPGGRFQGGVDGNVLHGLVDVRGTSRPDGRGYHAERRGRDRVVYLYQQQHPQQQLHPQQQQQPWSRRSLSMHDVQDRFHRLNFERARNGHAPSEAPVGSGMRAPQR